MSIAIGRMVREENFNAALRTKLVEEAQESAGSTEEYRHCC
jgi:hypothetical protein